MKRIFIGYDPRQPVAYNVCQFSLIRHASEPLAITPLVLPQLPITRRGLTEFTFSRFLVPFLCGFEGQALFMDSDVLATGDVCPLFEAADGSAVQVMQQQPRFEWPSIMLFDCAQCRTLTPEYVQDTCYSLFDFAWAGKVGTFPPAFNHCVGYQEPKEAILYHFTAGTPCWPETIDSEEAPLWTKEWKAMNHSCSYKELMGNSVHEEQRLAKEAKRKRPLVERFFEKAIKSDG